MVWQVFIRGHSFDLALLSEQFQAGPNRIVNDGEEHWLESDAFRELSSAEQVDVAATPILQRMNGVARLVDPSYRSVESVGRLQDGSGTYAVFQADTVELRSRVTGIVTVHAGDE